MHVQSVGQFTNRLLKEYRDIVSILQMGCMFNITQSTSRLLKDVGSILAVVHEICSRLLTGIQSYAIIS